MLGLKDSEDSFLRRALDDLRLRSPAEFVDRVVGLAEVDVDRGCQCGPPESCALGELFPAGCFPVALVEDDECLGDGCDVSDDDLGLAGRHAVGDLVCGVVLGEGGCAC